MGGIAKGIGGAFGGLPGMLAGGLAEDGYDMFDDVSDQSSTSRVILRDASDLETGALESQQQEFDSLRQLLSGDMGQQQADIGNARQSQMNLIQMLQQAQQGPSSQNVVSAQNFANSVFAPQEQALQQQFKQSETETSRLAARLGRQVDDPILRAKLAEAQAGQMGQLQAQKGAFAAQNAQGFLRQGLDMQSQIAGIRGGLATQALQNRQALMGMGQALINQERQFRLNTATRTGNAQTVQQGGFGDALGAITAIGGVGAKFAGMG